MKMGFDKKEIPRYDLMCASEYAHKSKEGDVQ
jgi:hypothetical protein